MAAIDRRGVSLSATDTPVAGNPNPGLAIKAPCRLATTANVTLAGLQVIDGVQSIDRDRVLVQMQTDPTQNGIYNASSGNWTRAIDAKGNGDWATGCLVDVTAGVTYSHSLFQVSSLDPIIVGTSAINFLPGNPLSNSLAPHSLAGNPTGATANITAIALGATLAFSGSALQTIALSGDVTTAANSFATAIAANAVTGAKFRQSAALSLVGNATNATANVTDIAAASDNQVLRRSGTAIGFGAVNLASANAVTGTLPAGNGGTGATTLGATLTVLGGSLQTVAQTGDVTTAANSFATTVAKIAGTTVSGTTGATNVVFSSSPTLSGTIGGTLTFSGITAFSNATAAINSASGAVVITGGLGVGGALFAHGYISSDASFGFKSNNVLVVDNSASYNRFYYGDGADVGILMGSATAADKTNYYRNDTHRFQSYANAATVAVMTTSYFSAFADNALSLGQDASHRWIAVFAVNGTIQTSDVTHKQIYGASDLGLDFVLKLRPIAYRYHYGDEPQQAHRNDAHDVRRHGFGAQDVVAALGGRAFAGVIRDESGHYGMNYSELIAPVVNAVQELHGRIAALEHKLPA